MKASALTLMAALGLPFGALATEHDAMAQESAKKEQRVDAEQIIKDWPDTAKKAAKAMTDKYGQPDEVTDSMLVWNNNGPWLRTIVYKEEVDHDFPVPHKDVLEQFVAYEVPPDKFDELAQYDGSVIAERTKGELSARCDQEVANYLALNLADDIITGERTVEQARDFYAETIKQVMQGEQPEYVTSLQFEPPPIQQARDSDERVITAAEVEQLTGPEQAEVAGFEQLDEDGDGAITREEAEASEQLSQSYEQYDADGDDRIDRAEFSAFEEEVQKEQKQN